VNPYGVQTDGIYTEGQGWDLSWDTVWRSDAVRTPRGYVVLVAILFKSLRFPATDRQQWGMFFFRAIARNNEQVYWPGHEGIVSAAPMSRSMVSAFTSGARVTPRRIPAAPAPPQPRIRRRSRRGHEILR
jgi:hypothetical protein